MTAFHILQGMATLPLRMQRHVENALSKAILSGQFKPGDHILVDAGPEGLAFRKAKEKVAARA